MLLTVSGVKPTGQVRTRHPHQLDKLLQWMVTIITIMCTRHSLAIMQPLDKHFTHPQPLEDILAIHHQVGELLYEFYFQLEMQSFTSQLLNIKG